MKRFEQPMIFVLGTILIVVGVYSLYLTSGILFDLFGERDKAGHYILISQICSFISSFIYIISGILFYRKSKLATTLLFIATVIMFIGYIGMLFHINNNKPFELYIIPEMLIRTTCTMLYAAVSWYLFSRMRPVYPDGYDAKSFRELMKDYEMQQKDHSNPNYH